MSGPERQTLSHCTTFKIFSPSSLFSFLPTKYSFKPNPNSFTVTVCSKCSLLIDPYILNSFFLSDILIQLISKDIPLVLFLLRVHQSCARYGWNFLYFVAFVMICFCKMFDSVFFSAVAEFPYGLPSAILNLILINSSLKF